MSWLPPALLSRAAAGRRMKLGRRKVWRKTHRNVSFICHRVTYANNYVRNYNSQLGNKVTNGNQTMCDVEIPRVCRVKAM